MTTWAELSDTEVGRTVRFTFPWADEPIEAVVRSTDSGIAGYTNDPGWVAPEPTAEQLEDSEWSPSSPPQVPAYRHILDYGGELGEQETQLAGSTPVELVTPGD